MRIIVAGDGAQVRHVLRILQGHGDQILPTRTRRETLDAVAHQHAELLVVALDSLKTESIEVIRTIHARSRVPILALAGQAGSAGQVAALDAGSDDFVTQPFAATELRARMRSLIRRASFDSHTRPTARIGSLTIDLATRELVRSVDETEQRVRLSPTEWAVLMRLLRTPDHLVTGRTLLHEVWGAGPEDAGSLRFYTRRLRKKIEPDPGHPQFIVTERGLGYRLIS